MAPSSGGIGYLYFFFPRQLRRMQRALQDEAGSLGLSGRRLWFRQGLGFPGNQPAPATAVRQEIAFYAAEIFKNGDARIAETSSQRVGGHSRARKKSTVPSL